MDSDRDPEKNLSAYIDRNHALSLTCVHEQVAKADCECPLYFISNIIRGKYMRKNLQAAGSRKVYELHGSIHRNYCMKCGKFYDAEYVKNSEGIPRCSCGGMIKPDVVLYEEGLDQKTIQGAVEAISSADMLIIGGTSLVVYPAAGFIDYFHGKHLVVINKSETARTVRAELAISAPIGEVLGAIHVSGE